MNPQRFVSAIALCCTLLAWSTAHAQPPAKTYRIGVLSTGGSEQENFVWTDLRRAMPICDRFAYFDHAGVAPLPRPAAEAMAAWNHTLNDAVTIAPVAGTTRTYRISGLAAFTNVDGVYRLSVNAAGVLDAFGTAGFSGLAEEWTRAAASPSSQSNSPPHRWPSKLNFGSVSVSCS